MRETLVLKVLFTTSVSMPEQYVAESCASTVIRSESNLATAMVMVVETLKISWNISLPATVPHSGWCVSGFGRLLHAAAYRLHCEAARKQ